MVPLSEFLEELRGQLDDVPAHDEEGESARLWKTAELLRYIDRAQDALCVYANYLPGEITVAVSAGEGEVNIPFRVTTVKDAKLVSAQRNLSIRNRDELNGIPADDYGHVTNARWRRSEGAPTVLVLDYAAGKGILVPKPTQDDDLIIVGSFLPRPVREIERFFAQRPDHVWALMPHVKMQAYSKHDADAYDPDLSQKYKMEALEQFNMVDHHVKLARKSPHSGAGTVRYGGIRL